MLFFHAAGISFHRALLPLITGNVVYQVNSCLIGKGTMSDIIRNGNT